MLIDLRHRPVVKDKHPGKLVIFTHQEVYPAEPEDAEDEYEEIGKHIYELPPGKWHVGGTWCVDFCKHQGKWIVRLGPIGPMMTLEVPGYRPPQDTPLLRVVKP